jgi:hypothetical protein
MRRHHADILGVDRPLVQGNPQVFVAPLGRMRGLAVLHVCSSLLGDKQ